MQQPFRERLEDYLSGRNERDRQELEALLAADPAARREIEEMQQHAEMLRVLRAPERLEPAPGFYARVMDCIETQRPVSVWDVFLQPMFARRLAYVSAALMLILGVWTISAEMQPELFASSPEVILSERPVARDLGIDHQRDRNVVLTNLASYQEY